MEKQEKEFELMKRAAVDGHQDRDRARRAKAAELTGTD